MADGIPYPQAPQYTADNPLQQAEQFQAMGLRAAQMQQVQQTAEQQARVNAAKIAVGQHMQAHIDPKTGEFNKYGFLGTVAQDPNAAVVFPEVFQTLLQNNEIEARTAGQYLQNEKAKLDVIGNSVAPYIQKIDEGKTLTDSDVSGLIGNLQAAHVFKDREEGLTMLQGLLGSPIGNRNNRNGLFRMLGQYSALSQQTLANTLQSAEKRFEPMTGVTASGEKYQIPKARVPGMLPPTGTEAILPEETAGGGTSAPRSELPAGQEPSPSEAPATQESGLPYGAVRTERAPLETARDKPYVDYKEGKGWLAESEKDAQHNAGLAYEMETKLKNQEEMFKLLRTGPLGTARADFAQFARGVLPKDAADRLTSMMLGTNDPDKAFAAAQALRKELAKNTFEQLKAALGGQGRFTNFELQTMLQANYGLDAETPAIERMMNDMRRVAKIAKVEAKALEQYRKVSLAHPRNDNSFSASFFNEKLRDKLINMGLYKEGEIKLTKDGDVKLPSAEAK